MTKAELVTTIADQTGESKRATSEFLEAFMRTVQAADTVKLVGFGTFAYKTRAARECRNPQTGAKMQLEESRSLTFKASKIKN